MKNLNLIFSLWIALAGIALPLAGQDDATIPAERFDRPLLTVSATGTERITATKADVRLAIEERGATDVEARERMGRRSSALMEFLRGENVERLETLALRLHPIYDYTQGNREVVGHQAMMVISFRADATGVGFIVDEAISRGANQVQELVFTAPESEIEDARLRALRTATGLAMKRADAVLEELGLTREKIHRIHLTTTEEPPPVVPFRAMEARTASADRRGTDLEGGEPEIEATVTLEIVY